MTEIYHLNTVSIASPYSENVCGHCLLLKEADRMVLIDTGIGLLDTLYPEERIGRELVEMVGYRFDQELIAIQQIKNLGLNPEKVHDCVISHLDNDHIGGLADFAQATVHVGSEEYENFLSGNPRYLKTPLLHNPIIKTYPETIEEWFGFEARKVRTALQTEILFIPLFGHTLGHCGVAIKTNENWMFYVGDAYYLREELKNTEHPVNALAEARADDNKMRIRSLNKIRDLIASHPDITVFGYHDIQEFKSFIKK